MPARLIIVFEYSTLQCNSIYLRIEMPLAARLVRLLFVCVAYGMWDLLVARRKSSLSRVRAQCIFLFCSTAQYGRLGRIHVHLGDSNSGGKVHQHNLNFRDLAIAPSL